MCLFPTSSAAVGLGSGARLDGKSPSQGENGVCVCKCEGGVSGQQQLSERGVQSQAKASETSLSHLVYKTTDPQGLPALKTVLAARCDCQHQVPCVMPGLSLRAG